MPLYPVKVEGLIFVESGEEDERVYEFKTDADSQLQTYRVQIPLWQSDEGGPEAQGLIVDAPFEPSYLPGFVYLPHYKGERVLVYLFPEDAQVRASLDWGSGVQPPLESLAQRIQFGKIESSQTAMSHAYEDNKPVFAVARNDAGDTQTITMSESVLILEVKQNEDEQDG